MNDRGEKSELKREIRFLKMFSTSFLLEAEVLLLFLNYDFWAKRVVKIALWLRAGFTLFVV